MPPRLSRPGALLCPLGPNAAGHCHDHPRSMSRPIGQPNCPKGHRFRAQSRKRGRAPWFTRSETLRQVFLRALRMARSASHSSFEFNCHLSEWPAGDFGRRTLAQRMARRPATRPPYRDALHPWTMTVAQVEGVKAARQGARRGSLYARPRHPGCFPRGGHTDPLLARTCPSVPPSPGCAACSTV